MNLIFKGQLKKIPGVWNKRKLSESPTLKKIEAAAERGQRRRGDTGRRRRRRDEEGSKLTSSLSL